MRSATATISRTPSADSHARVATEGQVKSAARVIDILEWFAEHRRPATIATIAAALDLPHSSATALLNSLRVRGYFDYEPTTRTFVPNSGLLVLTAWLAQGQTPMARILATLATVRDSAAEGVLLASLDGSRVRYDQVLLSPAPLQMMLQPGMRVPVHRTAAGIVLLAGLPPSEREAIIARSLAADTESERFPIGDVLEATALAERCGWHESRGSMSRGLSVIATRAGEIPGLGPVAIGVGGPIERIADKRETIIALLERATGRRLAHD